nr:type II toxin-antitoxin system VapC family toxin [Clostridium perfringens]
MLDTCTVIQLANENKDLLQFVKNAALNQVDFCYSVKTVEELNILSESQNFPPDKRQANANRGFFINSSQQQANRILNKINKIPNMCKEPIGEINSDMIPKIQENALKYKLRWGDAVILTIAKENNINGIVTFDGDYNHVAEDLTIFKGNNKV